MPKTGLTMILGHKRPTSMPVEKAAELSYGSYCLLDEDVPCPEGYTYVAKTCVFDGNGKQSICGPKLTERDLLDKRRTQIRCNVNWKCWKCELTIAGECPIGWTKRIHSREITCSPTGSYAGPCSAEPIKITQWSEFEKDWWSQRSVN